MEEHWHLILDCEISIVFFVFGVMLKLLRIWRRTGIVSEICNEQEVLQSEADSNILNHSHKKFCLTLTHYVLKDKYQVDDGEHVGFNDN